MYYLEQSCVARIKFMHMVLATRRNQMTKFVLTNPYQDGNYNQCHISKHGQKILWILLIQFGASIL